MGPSPLPCPVLVIQLCHHQQMRALRLRGLGGHLRCPESGQSRGLGRQPVPACHLPGLHGTYRKGTDDRPSPGGGTQEHWDTIRPTPCSSQPTALRLQCQGCQCVFCSRPWEPLWPGHSLCKVKMALADPPPPGQGQRGCRQGLQWVRPGKGLAFPPLHWAGRGPELLLGTRSLAQQHLP